MQRMHNSYVYSGACVLTPLCAGANQLHSISMSCQQAPMFHPNSDLSSGVPQEVRIVCACGHPQRMRARVHLWTIFVPCVLNTVCVFRAAYG